MSKALVHFFLCILGMLASFNFSEIRIFFCKDLPVLKGGGRLLASVSYCAGWRITSRGQNAEVLISLIFQFLNSVSSQMNGFFPHVKVVYRGPSRCLPSPGLPALRKLNVKGPLYGTFSYKKTRKKSTRALLKGLDSAQTVTRKSKCTQPQSPTDLFPDSYLELYRSLMCSSMCSIISYLVGIQQRFVLGALPFTYVLAHVLHNFLFSRYTVEIRTWSFTVHLCARPCAP